MPLSALQRIDRKILERATLVGIVLEVALVVTSYFVPWVEVHVFQFGGMMIAAIAGYKLIKASSISFTVEINRADA